MSSPGSLSFPVLLTPPHQPFFFCHVDTWMAVYNLVLLSLLVILESRAGGNHDPLQMCPEMQRRERAQTGQESCQSREAFAGATVGFGLHFKADFLKHILL